MISSTLNGETYRQKFSEEIKAAIEETKNRWYVANAYAERILTEKDFCIFVGENGYMVILKRAYAKMSKTKKKFIERSYEYRQIPE